MTATDRYKKKGISPLLSSDDERPVLLSSSSNISLFDNHEYYDDFTFRLIGDSIGEPYSNHSFASLLVNHHDSSDVTFDVSNSHHLNSALGRNARNQNVTSTRFISSSTTTMRHHYNRKSRDNCNSCTAISIIITVSGTCVVLFFGCMWMSYMMDWFTSDIVLEIIWSSNTTTGTSNSSSILPLDTTSLPIYQKSYDLISLLLPEARKCYSCTILLWISTVLMPCIFMVVLPMELYHLSKQQQRRQQRLQFSSIFSQQENAISVSTTDDNDHNTANGFDPFRIYPTVYYVFHTLIRFQYSIIYYIALFMIPVSQNQQIQMELHPALITTNTSSTEINLQLSIVTNAQSGFFLYTIGISCAIIFAMMVRWYSNTQRMVWKCNSKYTNNLHSRKLRYVYHDHDNILCAGRNQQHLSKSTTLSTMERNSNDNNVIQISNDTYQYPIMQILEDQQQPFDFEENVEESLNSNTVPLLQRTTISSIPFSAVHHTKHQQSNDSDPWWKLFTIFQCGLLCTLFFIPGICLPFYATSYKSTSDPVTTNTYNTATNILEDDKYIDYLKIPNHTTKSFSLFEIFNMIYENRRSSTYALCFLILFPSVILFPIAVIILSIYTWTTKPSTLPGDADVAHLQPKQSFVDERFSSSWPLLYAPMTISTSRIQYRNYLSIIHPIVGSVNLSIALLMGANMMHDWDVNSLYNDNNYTIPINYTSSTMIRLISHILAGTTRTGCIQIGGWFYIIHSILLEVLIIGTLLWS